MTVTTLLLLTLLLFAMIAAAFFSIRAIRPRPRYYFRAAARAAARAPVPAPVAEPAADLPSPFLAGPEGAPDDLQQIKGIGPKLETMLGTLGVFHYRQIADWTPAQLALVDSRLENFAGRPERDQWQSQARLLASGDRRAYERVHGKLGEAAGPAG